MQNQDESDKNFEPTEKKLLDARKKGDIAKSADINTVATYTGLVVASLMVSGEILSSFLTDITRFFHFESGSSGRHFEMDAYMAMKSAIWSTLNISIIMLGLPAVLVLVGSIAQGAVTNAPEKFAPKWSRVSILSNAKNKFGHVGLFEFFKSFLKLIIFSAILAFVLSSNVSEIIATAAFDTNIALVVSSNLVLTFFISVILISLAIAVVDFSFQKFSHAKKLRMSRKEVTDEHKEAEGDPHLKQERKNRARERAMSFNLSDVDHADVVITNPTHFSIALKWSKEPGTAPVCVAKGVDEIAASIRERAQNMQVPIHEDPPTARAIYARTAVGDEVPYDLYQAVAVAIRFAEAMKLKSRERGY